MNVGYMSWVPCDDEVHHRHEKRQVNPQLPVGGDAAAQVRPALGLALLPDLGLLDGEANEQRQQRRRPSEQEHRPPAETVEHEVRGHRRQQVAGGVPLLEEAAEQAAPPAPAPSPSQAKPPRPTLRPCRCRTGHAGSGTWSGSARTPWPPPPPSKRSGRSSSGCGGRSGRPAARRGTPRPDGN